MLKIKLIFLILLISNWTCFLRSQALGRASYGLTVENCKKNNRIVNCDFLMATENNKVSWNIEKIEKQLGFTTQRPFPLIFKYNSDAFPLSQGYYDHLLLLPPEGFAQIKGEKTGGKLFCLIAIDLSDLRPVELISDDEDSEHDSIINGQKIVFDFSSNQIQEIRSSDLYAIYSYLVGLADNYSAFFTTTSGVAFIFKNNKLSFITRIKLYLLRLILRLRLLLHGSEFFKYRYVDW